MAETAEQEKAEQEKAESKKPKRLPTIGDKVWYWLLHPTKSEKPFTPADLPCVAWVCGFDASGRANIAYFSSHGQSRQELGVPYSDVPKGRHWTWTK